jgi:phage baseplate assembly protein W
MTDAHLLTDIRLRLHEHALRAVYSLDEANGDLTLVGGRENLGQGVVMRLLTPMGEIEELGHPDYGCRMHELIGRPNTPTTRNLVKLHILEALQAEPRIDRIDSVTVDPVESVESLATVEIRVVPAEETEVVVIGPFTLELGP